MVEVHCFRFEGLHLEEVPGALLAGRIMQPSKTHAVSFGPAEPGRFRPRHALVMLDVALQRGDAIAYGSLGDRERTVRHACEDRNGESYQRALFLQNGTELEVCLVRNGHNIVSRLRWNDGRMELVQDKPAGC